MARNLTDAEKEYLLEAMYGYLNGFNDVGESEYPKLSVEELAEYGYKTIAFDAEHGEPQAKALYFCGKDTVMKQCLAIISDEEDFAACCYDWEA